MKWSKLIDIGFLSKRKLGVEIRLNRSYVYPRAEKAFVVWGDTPTTSSEAGYSFNKNDSVAIGLKYAFWKLMQNNKMRLEYTP